MSVKIGGKPLLSWNTEFADKAYACNHICMFNHPTFNSNIKRQTNYLHHNTALYFRYKTYSTPYHEFLTDKCRYQNSREGGGGKGTVKEEDMENAIIPAGCLEFFCNHLHITKDKSHIPTISTIISNLLPLSTPFSATAATTTLSSNPSTTLHKDLFIQCSIENFSLDYVTSTNPSLSPPSQQLSVSLHQLKMAYYSNLNCSCFPSSHERECLVDVIIDEFTVTCGK